MSVAAETLSASRTTDWRTWVRVLCAGVATIVVVDAAVLQAPYLTFLAVPFIITAIGLRKAHLVTLVAVFAWSALYVLLGANYIIANGFDAPASDLVFALVGTPMAAAIAFISASRMPRSRR
jgi:hypothetical protein